MKYVGKYSSRDYVIRLHPDKYYLVYTKLHDMHYICMGNTKGCEHSFQYAETVGYSIDNFPKDFNVCEWTQEDCVCGFYEGDEIFELSFEEVRNHVVMALL